MTTRRVLVIVAFVLLAAAAGGAWWWQTGGRPAQDAFERALTAVEQGDYATARAGLAELQAAPADQSRAALVRGAILLHKGYFYPALDELAQAEDAPALAERRLTLVGQAWYHLGRHVEAQAALRQVLETDPSAVAAHRWLAASYYDLGAIHDAIRHLEQTAGLDPADHRPQRLLGLIYKDYERYEDAVPQYQESLRRKGDQPDWTDVREELAACQAKMRQHREALATLEPCPQSPAVLVLRAECRHALGETALAKADLAKALAAKPDSLDALVLHGTILLEDGHQEQAIAAFQQAVQASPQDYIAHFKLAQAHAQAGQAEQAAAEQKIADHIRDVRKVFADLHQAAWDNPEDAGIRLRLAQLAKELGRPDLEQVWLKSAAALQPLPVPMP